MSTESDTKICDGIVEQQHSLQQSIKDTFNLVLSRLGDNNHQGENTQTLSYLISLQNNPAELWTILESLLTREINNESLVEAICIGVIEPATEPPVCYTDMKNYMRFLRSKELSFILFSAYDREDFPDNLLSDYILYKKNAIAENSTIVTLNYGYLQEYIDTCRCDMSPDEQAL